MALLNHKDCFQRTHLPGHITGSAWMVNGDRTKTLLVHHAKLNKWVQPGGHADGDENILNVALREAEEETGLKNLKPFTTIFDVDIHKIPARKDFPEHFHYDIRFLTEADETEKIIVSDESHDVKWVSMNELENFTMERSVLRMKDKLLPDG
ncbi:MAG: NUDIX hydrolase [Bacteroidetes bacterium]|nr:NUDIX hydrolase [Bacteroidota bacterium]